MKKAKKKKAENTKKQLKLADTNWKKHEKVEIAEASYKKHTNVWISRRINEKVKHFAKKSWKKSWKKLVSAKLNAEQCTEEKFSIKPSLRNTICFQTENVYCNQSYCLCLYLMCQVGAELQHPVPPLLYGYAHSPPTLHRDGAQRVVLWQLNHQLNVDVIHRVGGNHLSCRWASLHLEPECKYNRF